jgi:hypothetical protein
MVCSPHTGRKYNFFCSIFLSDQATAASGCGQVFAPKEKGAYMPKGVAVKLK